MAERAAKQLELNKSELPNSIIEVIATLSRAGFDAYIVGGGVRDTLLGLRPKDFDAVTDAKPHEVKDVFGKRCRVIGRRFQLAHVYSGRDLIEVATFRAPPTNDAHTTQEGMLIRDNVWGDIKQDFARRDFSINALYYQPLKGIVHDFCGAVDDINSKTLRLLGDAPVRIEEDPVRLLRALRFKAKLGFDFDDALAAQFHDDNWALLDQISPHRLYDESQKMFTGGYLVPLLPLLFESGAIEHLIIYPPSEPTALVQQVAVNTDKRIGAGKSINPAFFYAALLWDNYLYQLDKFKKRNMPFADAQMQAASKVIDRQRIKTAIPKFAEQFIRDIWLLQPKLSAPRSKQIVQLAEHPRFRAGFDFLLLREECGDSHPLAESTNGMGAWWQHYQTLSEDEQQAAIANFDDSIRRGSHKRSRNRKRQKDAIPSPVQSVSVETPQKRGNATRGSKRARSQQNKQDTHELQQLQQLSLANHDSAQDASNRPQPLFVANKTPVVPKLQRQTSARVAPPVKDKEAFADKKVAPKKADSTKAAPKVVAKAPKPAPDTLPPVVAQTPKEAGNSQTPIPAKRRRRALSLTQAPAPKTQDEAPKQAAEDAPANTPTTPDAPAMHAADIDVPKTRRKRSSRKDNTPNAGNADTQHDAQGSTQSATTANKPSDQAPNKPSRQAKNSDTSNSNGSSDAPATKKTRKKAVVSAEHSSAQDKGPIPAKRRRRAATSTEQG
ncbi:polynucleotide adenylyltransferase PcnB [Psychrobacter aestuarii]|uniref:Poly(A) polymerase I n=1 Tax=Psychrobacter aestuarii TaxID=556327 RepID=A0ABP3FQA1_9GAMM|nr:polynucleotide adenylyltransferase PcnB [Psychrobacter aestuarii]